MMAEITARKTLETAMWNLCQHAEAQDEKVAKKQKRNDDKLEQAKQLVQQEGYEIYQHQNDRDTIELAEYVALEGHGAICIDKMKTLDPECLLEQACDYLEDLGWTLTPPAGRRYFQRDNKKYYFTYQQSEENIKAIIANKPSEFKSTPDHATERSMMEVAKSGPFACPSPFIYAEKYDEAMWFRARAEYLEQKQGGEEDSDDEEQKQGEEEDSDDEEMEIARLNAEVGWKCVKCGPKSEDEDFAYHEVKYHPSHGTLCLKCYRRA